MGYMKHKASLLKIIFFLAFAQFAFGQELPFPPELKWWIDEIQKIDSSASVEKFKFREETFIYQEDGELSYKNKLYPVLKKWNYYGDKFAYYSLMLDLKKEKSGKYSLLGEPDSVFAIFDRNETVLFIDFFGSSGRLDSFCWVRDNRIIAVGTDIVNSYENGRKDVDFVIYDYQLKDGKAIIKKYIYSKKGVSLKGLRLRWFEQRDDYFEME